MRGAKARVKSADQVLAYILVVKVVWVVPKTRQPSPNVLDWWWPWNSDVAEQKSSRSRPRFRSPSRRWPTWSGGMGKRNHQNRTAMIIQTYRHLSPKRYMLLDKNMKWCYECTKRTVLRLKMIWLRLVRQVKLLHLHYLKICLCWGTWMLKYLLH